MRRFRFFNKKGGILGFSAGIIASLCCVTPLFLILLGLGTVSFAFSFIGYKNYFLVGSFLFLLFGFFLHFRKRKCSLWSVSKSPFVISALAFHLIIFIGIFYFLLPTVGPYIFEKRLDLGRNNVPEHSFSCHLKLNIRSKSFEVLQCESCEKALKYHLENNKGVIGAEVDLSRSEALVHYEKEKIFPGEIIDSIPSTFKINKKSNYCN